MAPGGSAGCDMLESQTMASYTFATRSSPRRGPPLDLVLHSLQDALTGAATQAAAEDPTSDRADILGTLACALTRAIDPSALASAWADDGDADIAGAHIARRLANPGGTPNDPRPTSNAGGRALETAVARRLADTACALSITGDKEDAAHASALWEAAATLTGLLPPYTGDTLRAADIASAINGAAPPQPNPSYEPQPIGSPMPNHLPSTPRVLQSADEAPRGSLMQCHNGDVLLRLWDGTGWRVEFTGSVPTNHGGWLWGDSVGRVAGAHLIAKGLTETECRHLSGLSEQDAIAWCERRDKDADLRVKLADYESSGPFAKPRPQPGDVVPWAEVEDGCLYWRSGGGYPFRMVVGGRALMMHGPDDKDIQNILHGRRYIGITPSEITEPSGTLIARDLGSDPEAWRQEMREWTANGGKQSVVPERSMSGAEAVATLALVRAALAVPGADDIVAHARQMKATADVAERYVADALKGQREAKDELVVAIDERDAAISKAQTAEAMLMNAKSDLANRDGALAEMTGLANRRLQALHQSDDLDSATREYLGAGGTESTVDAARRVVKERDAAARDLQSANLGAANVKAETDRLLAQAWDNAKTAIEESVKLRAERDAIMSGSTAWSAAERDTAHAERDAAVRLAEQRLSAIMAQDKLAAEWGDKYTTVCAERDAALSKAKRDPCATCREERSKAVAELEEGRRQSHISVNAAQQTADMAIKGRDIAIAERDASRDEVKNLRAGRAEDVRPLHDEFTLPAARAGVPMWMCLMTGPCKAGGRWSLETNSERGDLRVTWPNGVSVDLADPRRSVNGRIVNRVTGAY